MSSSTETSSTSATAAQTYSSQGMLQQLSAASPAPSAWRQPTLPAYMAGITLPHIFSADERAAVRARLRTLALELQLYQAAAEGMSEDQRQYNLANAVWPVVQAMIDAEQDACSSPV